MAERIEIQISESGSRVVRRNLQEIGETANRADKGVQGLQNVLRSLAGVMSVAAIVKMADSYTNLTNRLRSTGIEGQNLTQVYKELLGVANSTRGSIEGTVDLYARLSMSSKELGTSQSELIAFTKTLNQSIILSGASSQEAAGALAQLGQGMGSGVLQGEELKSVLENLPAVADVIADHMKAARGELKQLGADGKITGKKIVDAFKAAEQSVGAKFALTVPTLAQAMQVLKNNTVDMVGSLDKATGTSSTLAKIILALGENIDTVAKVAASLAAGFALFVGVPAVIGAVTTAFKALTLAIAANPIGALLVVLTSAVTALVLFRDQIGLGGKSIASLGDLFRSLWQTFVATFGQLGAQVAATFKNIGGFLGYLTEDFEFSISGILRFAAKGVDSFLGLFKGAFDAIVKLFKELPSVLEDITIQGINKILSSLKIDFQLENTAEGKAANYGADIKKAFNEGFESVTFAGDFVDGILDGAETIAAERLRAEAEANAPLAKTEGVDPGLAGKQKTDAINDLQALRESYFTVVAAQAEMTEAENVLNTALAGGLITKQEYNTILGQVKQSLEDQLDPMGAIERELEKEKELIGLTAKERDRHNQLLEIEKSLRADGVAVSKEYLAGLDQELQKLQQAAELRAAKDDLLGPKEENAAFDTKVQAAGEMVRDGELSQGGAVEQLNDSVGGALEGTQEMNEAIAESYAERYRRIAQMEADGLISHQSAEQAKSKVVIAQNEQRLAGTRSMFASLASLSTSENKKLAMIGKAAAIATATMDGVIAVQKAYTGMPYPANIPAAVAQGVLAAANVAKIAGIGFETGGSMIVGGAGGPDSQQVSFRATPGEKVTIATPRQVRKGDSAVAEGSGSGASVNPTPVKVVNVLDPAMMGDYLATEEGERLIMNTLHRNPGEVRNLSR